MAMAERFLAERFNRPGDEIVDHHTYAICSDGDMMEGVCQEAASIAGHFALGKLIVCYDDNHITIDGTTAISFDSENHPARYADGWHVQRVADSEDVDALQPRSDGAAGIDAPVLHRDPLAHRLPGAHAVDTAKAHGAPLGEEEVRATKEVMGFDPERSSSVDERVYEHMSLRETGGGRAAGMGAACPGWSERYPRNGRGVGAGLVRQPARWLAETPCRASSAGEGIATRSAGPKGDGGDQRRTGPPWPVARPTWWSRPRPFFEGAGEFSRVHAGRNIPFGIREHAMGAIVNGLAAHGGIVKPYGSTFLVFSDYMRGACGCRR